MPDPQTPAATKTLAQMVRAKYPGVYDDLSDTDLESKVKAKYPGVYDGLPTTPINDKTGGSVPGPQNIGADLVRTTMNVAGNAGAAITNPIAHPLDTAAAIGRLPIDIVQSHMAEGQKSYDAFMRGDRSEGVLHGLASIVPVVGPLLANYFETDQAGREQIAGNVIGGLATGKAITAVPGAVRSLGSAEVALRESAVNSEARALGTTSKMADQARDLAPEMIARGVKGTRASMLEGARAAVGKTGAAIDAEVARATQAGQTVSTRRVIDAISDATRGFLTETSGGGVNKFVVTPGYEGVVGQLDKIRGLMKRMGSDMTVEQAQSLKTAWDDIVAKAGLYGKKAAQPASDAAKAEGFKVAANALRKQLNSNPTLEALNKEYEFQVGLKSILEDTGDRLLGKNTGLGQLAGAGVGAAVGQMTGATAPVGAMLGVAGVKLLQSPYWQSTISAPLKNALADALVSGNANWVSATVRSMISTLPAKVRPLFITATGAAAGPANLTPVLASGRMGGAGRQP